MTAQSANFQLGESREAAGQLAEAAELLQEGGRRNGRTPVPPAGRAVPRGAGARRAGHGRARAAQGGAREAREVHPVYPGGRHIAAAREALARLQIHSGDYAGAEATIATLARMPKAGERAAVLRTRVLATAREARRGHRRAGSPDRLVAQGLANGSEPPCSPRPRASPPPRSSRKPRPCVREVIQGNPAEDAASQAPAYNTLGDCLRAANRPKEALIAYLHTDMLYSKDKEEHPRALAAIAAIVPPAQAGRPRRRVHPASSSRSIPAARGTARHVRVTIKCRRSTMHVTASSDFQIASLRTRPHDRARPRGSTDAEQSLRGRRQAWEPLRGRADADRTASRSMMSSSSRSLSRSERRGGSSASGVGRSGSDA